MYQNSKLHFFKFVKVLHEHLDPSAYKLCYIGDGVFDLIHGLILYSDTDSLMLGYAAQNLTDIVKPEKVQLLFEKLINHS